MTFFSVEGSHFSPFPFHSALEIHLWSRLCILALHFQQKNSLFFIRSAISLFASWFLHCLFFRFARFLQQSSHPILVPQPENRQCYEFWRTVPDAAVETLTGYSKPLG